VFKITFERWVDEGNEQNLGELDLDSLAELKAITGGQGSTA
jgi:hypothetical protein